MSRAVATLAPEPLDVRLTAGAALAWLALLCCLSRPPGVVAAVVAVALGMGGLALGAARRGARWASTVALAGFCVALVLAPFAGRLAHARDAPLGRLAVADARVSASLTAAGDPRQLAVKGVGGPVRTAVDTTVQSLALFGRNVAADGHVLVVAQSAGWQDLLPGQRMQVDGRLQPSHDDPTGATLFTNSPPRLIGRPPWWQRARGAHPRLVARRRLRAAGRTAWPAARAGGR